MLKIGERQFTHQEIHKNISREYIGKRTVRRQFPLIRARFYC